MCSGANRMAHHMIYCWSSAVRVMLSLQASNPTATVGLTWQDLVPRTGVDPATELKVSTWAGAMRVHPPQVACQGMCSAAW